MNGWDLSMTTINQMWDENKDVIINYCKLFEQAFTATCLQLQISSVNELRELKDPQLIGNFCQTMWEMLPDSPIIRQSGFFQLCNIAEEFCFGDDE